MIFSDVEWEIFVVPWDTKIHQIQKEFDDQNSLIELKKCQIFHCAGNSQIIHFSKLERRLVCSKVTSLLLSHFRHFTT